jgi:CRISPR-associated endonuclease/helicase Cas3
VIEIINKPNKDLSTPNFFYEKDLDSFDESVNEKNIVVRGVLISADRIASNVEYDTNKIIKNDIDYIKTLLNNEKNTFIFNKHPTYSNDVGSRFNKQKEIVNSINKHTTLIKAPAGFGKTLLGLLWGLKNKKKLLWVCPRNVVVESVYSSILEELSNLNLEKEISVELFLTGKRKECNLIANILDDFTSDIVVTNIDNFLSPTHKNKSMHRMYSIFDYNVVFDEFHEFVNENPMFSAFIEIMNLRHNIIKSNTLLLSATPMTLNFLWDGVDNETLILPNKNDHYKAIHNKPYNIKIETKKDLINSNGDNKNTLTIYNSIINSQRHKKINNTEIIAHSDFIEEDKMELLDEIFFLYGKKNKGESDDKKSVVSAPIIQASMDISFKHLKESISSPEETLQRIGRCNRWGEYDDSLLTLLDLFGNNAERGYIQNIKNSDEQKKWVEFLKNNLTKDEIILDKFYLLYNKFNNENIELRKCVILKKLKESYRLLEENISPKKYGSSKKSVTEKMLVTDNNNLRTTSEGYFCTFELHDKPNTWITPPFNLSLKRNFVDEDLEEDKNEDTPKIIRKIMKELDGKDGFIYGYKKYYKKIENNLTRLKRQLFDRAKYDSNAPYIGLNKKYSKKYGLAKNEIYED